VAESQIACSNCIRLRPDNDTPCPYCGTVTPAPDFVPLNGDEGLTARLCRAVGLDANAVQGFRLTVIGGEFPKLEVLKLLPEMNINGHIRDPWSEPLIEVATSYELRPTVGTKPHGYTRPPMLVDLDEAIETFDGSPHGDFLINVRNALLAITVTTAEAEAGAKAVTDALQTQEVPDAGDR
jgi:hypothetical protein